MELKHTLNIYIVSQKAEATPPLGTVLGNLGVNAVKFCKDFNDFTADLPAYITLPVRIVVYENRSYIFSVGAPPLGPIIGLLRFEKEDSEGQIRQYISLQSLIQLALWRFPRMDLKKSVPILLGTLRSSSLDVAIDD